MQPRDIGISSKVQRVADTGDAKLKQGFMCAKLS